LAIALDQIVYVWNADSGEVHDFCSTADDDYVSSLSFSADGSFLAVGASNGDIQIYDVEASSRIRNMKGHSSRVSVLSWNQHTISSGAWDGDIFNHDSRTQNQTVSEYRGHTAEICGLKWRPDGQLLASGGNDKLVNIWDARVSLLYNSRSLNSQAHRNIPLPNTMPL
jgi:cell division cycle protein 20 (cofactor of APC complex)